MQNMNVEEYKRKSRELESQDAKKGLVAHAAIISAVSVVLIAVNLAFVSEFLWCVFPVVGMSIGVAVHYLFGVRLLDRSLAEKEMRIEQWR